jgi:hypothetical protein
MGVCNSGEDLAVTSKRSAPASEHFPLQLALRSVYQIRVALQINPVLLDNLGSGAVFANDERVSPFARTPDINVVGFAFAVNNETIHVDPPSVVVIPYGCVREPAGASKAACNAGLPWRAAPPAAVRKGAATAFRA